MLFDGGTKMFWKMIYGGLCGGKLKPLASRAAHWSRCEMKAPVASTLPDLISAPYLTIIMLCPLILPTSTLSPRHRATRARRSVERYE